LFLFIYLFIDLCILFIFIYLDIEFVIQLLMIIILLFQFIHEGQFVPLLELPLLNPSILPKGRGSGVEWSGVKEEEEGGERGRGRGK